MAIVEKPQDDAMENWEQVRSLRKGLLTLATLARHDGAESSLFSSFVFYFPCLSLPSIWLNLSVLANALGWTEPCQTWIHQSLSAGCGGMSAGEDGGGGVG